MGNLCGKQSKDAFDGPGRTLGSAPAPTTKASVPANANANRASTTAGSQKRTVGGPPRTLGEINAEGDPKSTAAAAAEARANKNSTGDLQKRLDAQKRETRKKTLESLAKANNAHREADNDKDKLQYR